MILWSQETKNLKKKQKNGEKRFETKPRVLNNIRFAGIYIEKLKDDFVYIWKIDRKVEADLKIC